MKWKSASSTSEVSRNVYGFFPTEHYFYLMDQLIEKLWFVRLVNVINRQ